MPKKIGGGVFLEEKGVGLQIGHGLDLALLRALFPYQLWIATQAGLFENPFT